MRFRKKVSKKRANRKFNKGRKLPKKNIMGNPMRGGIRL